MSVSTEASSALKDLGPELSGDEGEGLEMIQETLRGTLAHLLMIEASEIGLHDAFVSLGLDSITAVEWLKLINSRYGTTLSIAKVYDYPNLAELSSYLDGLAGAGCDGQERSAAAAGGIARLGSKPQAVVLPVQDPPAAGLPGALRQQSRGPRSQRTEEALRAELRTSLSHALLVDPEEIDPDAKFIDLGLDSIAGVEWLRSINDRYLTAIPATKLYQHASLAEFAQFLKGELDRGLDGEADRGLDGEADRGLDGEADRGLETGLDQDGGLTSVPLEAPSLSAGIGADPAPRPGSAASMEDLREGLRRSLAAVLLIDVEEVRPDLKFIDMGLDSITAVEWLRSINKEYGTTIAVTKLYEHPTVAEFAELLSQRVAQTSFAAPEACPPSAVRAQGRTSLPAAEPSQVPSASKAPKDHRDKAAPPSPSKERILISLSGLPEHREAERHQAEETPSAVTVEEVEPGVVVVTMQDRIDKNCFSEALVLGMADALKTIAAHPGYKVVILTGYDSYFSSGGTKEGLMAILEGRVDCTVGNIFNFALECKLPVIAAMQGHAIGAGWALGMFCDFVLMSRESYYASNFMKYGFTPGAGATLVFPLKFGAQLAQEILFTGKRYRGQELERRGIPFPVLPRNEVLPYALALAKELADSPRDALIALKERLSEEIRAKLGATVEKEIALHNRTFVNQPEVRRNIHSAFDLLPAGAPGKEAVRLVSAPKRLDREVILPQRNAEPVPVDTAAASTRGAAAALADNGVGCAASDPARDCAIAIIGMSGRFPKSRDLAELWENLAAGRDCISEIPRQRWYQGRSLDEQAGSCSFDSEWMGVLDDVDLFDPLFFSISPADAEHMDPQQRLFLQSCWHCIEESAVRPSSLSGSRCGVFVGCGAGDYGSGQFQVQEMMGGLPSILAARISYLLNLKGPCLAIDTACSSSLVAIAEACNNLVLGNCDLALAGGVFVAAGPAMHQMCSGAGMLSRDGRCFTFDNSANGFVPGEGVGVILLKRLSEAVRDQDQIHGVIRGWGVNQDGKTNGITAPCASSQLSLEKEVYQRFGIHPETISLVEAHGTGTKLGDPIEVEALTDAFQAFTDKKNYCAIGSIKANIGHSMTAAGVAGVIKVLLALQHRMLPPLAHFTTLNEHIELNHSPFFINTALQPWEAPAGGLRRAAVSSFGLSGTNAHLVIEEYGEPAGRAATPADTGTPILFILSAKSQEQLKEYAQRMQSFVLKKPELSLADLGYTLQVGREPMKVRLAFSAHSRDELLQRLAAAVDGREADGLFFSRVGKGKADGVNPEPAQEGALLQAVAQKKWDTLASWWVNGGSIDWNLLYREPRPRRVSLPTYPFARERYWIARRGAESPPPSPNSPPREGGERPPCTAAAGGGPEAGAVACEGGELAATSLQEPFEVMTFQELWQEQALEDCDPVPIRSLVCFLSEGSNRKAVADTVAASGETRVVFISQGEAYRKHSALDYEIQPTGEGCQEALRSICEEQGGVDAVLYLWPLEHERWLRDCSPIVSMLKGIAALKEKPRSVLLAGKCADPLQRCYLEAWLGFERSLGLLLPRTGVATVLLDGEAGDGGAAKWMPKLWDELQSERVESVLYQGGGRHVCRFVPAPLSAGGGVLRAGGTYLITGGAGGLGLLFAEHLVSRHRVNLILTGRSHLGPEQKSKIEALKASGSRVLYLRADVADADRMQRGLDRARGVFGGIDGVIHAAGSHSKKSILEKELSEFEQVLAPKVQGTLVLDELLREDALDFVCYFSSSSALLGDFGSCDYAVGNRFQMAYAAYRNREAEPGGGGAVAICWPLWKDVGMKIGDREATRRYLKASGQRALEAAEGLFLFEPLLAQPHSHALVLAGVRSRVHRFLGLDQDRACHIASPAVGTAAGQGQGKRPELEGLTPLQRLEWDLTEQAGRLLKVSREKLDREEDLADFGFDSISLIQFSTALTNYYGIDITPALFLGHSSIAKLAQHLFREHEESIREFYRDEPELLLDPMLQLTEGERAKPPVKEAAPPAASLFLKNRARFPELIHMNQVSEGRPVFWFHGGLGGGEVYQKMVRDYERPFYGIQSRGWKTERAPLHGLQAMASYYIQIIQSVQPEGPYDVGGYSHGGIIAYEVTRQLQELGETVDTLVMGDSLDGQALKSLKPTKRGAMLQAVNVELATMLEPKALPGALIKRDELKRLSKHDDDQLLLQLVKLARRRGLTDPEEELHRRFKQHVRAQLAYEIERVEVLSLPDPETVRCYYFRNRKGLFYGALDPYLTDVAGTTSSVDKKKYWGEWEQNLPNFCIMDVDCANHMTLFSEPESSRIIGDFCRQLYSRQGLGEEFLASFLQRHGTSRNAGRYNFLQWSRKPAADTTGTSAKATGSSNSSTTASPGSGRGAITPVVPERNVPMLKLSNVVKKYPGKSEVMALAGIDLDIQAGEMVAIMGPSGSGKSTLLNLLGGLDVPSTGSIRVAGTDLSPLNETERSLFRRSGVSYIFQAYHLMPTLTVSQNVALPLHLSGLGQKDIAKKVAAVLNEVGLEERGEHLPDELSGGERQRVAIARALITNPPLLLADEPTGNLDSARGEEILGLLKSIHRERKTTVVMVTHDPKAASACQRLIKLRDGKVEGDSAIAGGSR